jgi:hypothetical protein
MIIKYDATVVKVVEMQLSLLLLSEGENHE